MKTTHFFSLAAVFAALTLVLLSSCGTMGDGDNGGGSSSIEYNGQTYKTVKIGTQTWMAENLNYAAEGSKCYDNDPANCNKYGRLYDWATAMNACPSGWHIPNNDEWEALIKFADPNYDYTFYNNVAGTKLKAISGWNGGGNGTNAFGFAALPSGSGTLGCSLLGGGYLDECFRYVGNSGAWWSSTSEDNDYIWHSYMVNDFEYAELDVGSKTGYFISIRCIQD